MTLDAYPNLSTRDRRGATRIAHAWLFDHSDTELTFQPTRRDALWHYKLWRAQQGHPSDALRLWFSSDHRP